MTELRVPRSVEDKDRGGICAAGRTARPHEMQNLLERVHLLVGREGACAKVVGLKVLVHPVVEGSVAGRIEGQEDTLEEGF